MMVVETCRGRELAAACPREEREREVSEAEEGTGGVGARCVEGEGRGTVLLGV